MTSEKLRQLLSVDRLLGEEAVRELVATYGHRQTVDALRETLQVARDEVRAGAEVPGIAALAARASAWLRARLAPA